MESQKVFLESQRSASASNTSGGLHISLEGKKKFLPFDETYALVSQNEQYTKERMASNKIRLTAQVNVVASNVLFNDVTEVIYKEGSPDVRVLNYGEVPDTFNAPIYGNKELSWFSGNTFKYYTINEPPIESDNVGTGKITNAIRDTQLSNQGFIYHCGRDIFNNHLLRSTSFKTVVKSDGKNDAFNTICDTMRDVDGNRVEEYVLLPMAAGVAKTIDEAKKQLHLYIADDILEFDECVESKLIKKYNGWVGFENVAKIPSYNDFPQDITPMPINKVIGGKNGGDFIDMYPERDLFLFPPLYNEYRHRPEKNWECCVTYPSSSITQGQYISGENGFLNEAVNSMKTIYFNENTLADNGVRQIVLYSIAKHGLTPGDTVSLYLSSLDGNTEHVDGEFVVSTVVDDFIFVINNDELRLSDAWVDLDTLDDPSVIEIDDVEFKYSMDGNCYLKTGDTAHTKYYVVENRWVNLSDEYRSLSYKKVSSGLEVEYYVRIFSRLPNFKFAEDEINAVTLYNDNLLSKYLGRRYEFDNHQSKLAFAKNIYGDQLGQIVFTDDIDLSYLKDNLGRPLTSIYLSFFKANRGYREWYGFGNTEVEPSSDKVEFSHCFGPLTCAFELSDESMAAQTIPNIKSINNYDVAQHGLWCGEFLGNPSQANGVERYDYEISYDNDLYFYGDIAYYDSANAMETVIQPILHRFNTAQRESALSAKRVTFDSFNIDELASDDFDADGAFKIATTNSSRKYFDFSNKRKEGYYYQPHYEVPIKTFGRLTSITPDFLTIRSITHRSSDQTTLVNVVESHSLSKGDKAMLMYVNPETGEQTYYTLVTQSAPTYRTFTCEVYDENWNKVSLPQILPSSSYRLDYTLFKLDNIGVENAKLVKDGSCRLLWRPLLQNGEADENAVEQYPFTNGAFYVNKGVDIMVRRQDPDDRYGLYAELDIIGNIEDANDEDIYIKEDEIAC